MELYYRYTDYDPYFIGWEAKDGMVYIAMDEAGVRKAIFLLENLRAIATDTRMREEIHQRAEAYRRILKGVALSAVRHDSIKRAPIELPQATS